MGSYITADLCEVFKGYSGSRIQIKSLITTFFIKQSKFSARMHGSTRICKKIKNVKDW